MVSNLHKELPCKVEKLKYKKLKVMQPRIENKSERPVWISPHGVLLSLLINTVYYSLVNDNKGREGGLKKRGSYQLSSPEKEGLIREGVVH